MFETAMFSDLVGIALLCVLILLVIKTIVTATVYWNNHLLSLVKTFWLHLQSLPKEDVDSDIIPTICNFKDAAHVITIVMNPSCPKCANVYDTIRGLGGCRINLVLTVNEGDEESHDAALAMITSGITKDWSETDKVIRHWYAKQELPTFLKPHYRAKEDLKTQMEYCRKIHIEGTPTILIDNHRLPDIYNLDDLKVLL